eukprot:c642_g1_i1.p2 GENE.c642_g1_i1~~c642_g1_i1.p2  ORF type:complete len:342 (+),score=64.35 c642_g1_i1:146-1027(+)
MVAFTEFFPIHPVTVEDCLSSQASDKFEQFQHRNLSYLFCSVNALGTGNAPAALHVLLRPRATITLHAASVSVLDRVQHRIRDTQGGVVPSVDWMLYACLDGVVDACADLARRAMEEVFVLDEMTMVLSLSEEHDLLVRMRAVRTEVSILHRLMMPKRAFLQGIAVQPLSLISDSVKLYLRDVLDHVVEQTQSLESAREVLHTAHANYLGAISLELARSGRSMDKSMANLSLVGAIFMPLTFITGLMGMNCVVPSQNGTKAERWWVFWAIFLFCIVFGIVGTPILQRRMKKGQ